MAEPAAYCSQLRPDENQTVVQALGSRCRALALGVTQLYTAQDGGSWAYVGCGAAALIKDSNRRSYFLGVVDIEQRQKIFEQELYNEFTYTPDRPTFHTFSTDTGLAAFSFCAHDEAQVFYEKVNIEVGKKATKRAQHARATAPPTTPLRNDGAMSALAPPSPMGGARPGSVSTPNSGTMLQRPGSAVSSSGGSKYSKGAKKGQSTRKKLTKDDIGKPSDFRHIGHIGFNPETGFDVNNIPKEWQELFDRAGLSREQLQDKDTAAFIMRQMEDLGMAEGGQPTGAAPPPAAPVSRPAAPRSGAPPPPPPVNRGRTAAPPPPPSRGRAAAPPPPRSTGAPPPPPPQRGPAAPAPPPAQPSSAAAPPPPPPPPAPTSFDEGPPPPPPPSGGGGGPPPPPPPPAPVSFDDGPPPPPAGGGGPPPPPPQQARAPPPVSDSRGGLLEEIQRGRKLNHVTEQTSRPPPPSNDLDSIANALRDAVLGRGTAIRGSDEEDGGDSDDDWDE